MPEEHQDHDTTSADDDHLEDLPVDGAEAADVQGGWRSRQEAEEEEELQR